jgi:hypothetical protein
LDPSTVALEQGYAVHPWTCEAAAMLNSVMKLRRNDQVPVYMYMGYPLGCKVEPKLFQGCH